MDHKKSPIRRAKRQSKVLEDFWDCSVCTFRNTEDSFKCLMCDVRKGTSTRKPRLNSALVAQQAATLPGTPAAGGSAATTTAPTAAAVAAPAAAVPATNGSTNHHYHKPGSNSSSSTSSSSTAKMHRTGGGGGGSSGGSVSSRGSKLKHKKFARLKNVDRSTAQTREVTVNSVTVVITEYKPKTVVNRRESSDQSYSESNDSRS